MAMAAARVGSGEEKVAAARGPNGGSVGGGWVSRPRHLRQSIAGVLVARDQMAQRGLPAGPKLPRREHTRDPGRGAHPGKPTPRPLVVRRARLRWWFWLEGGRSCCRITS